MNFNTTLNINTLFSSLPISSNESDASFHSLSSLLSDYNLIKTGSYGKLMSAYYEKNPDTTFENPVLSQVNVVDNNQLELVQTNAKKVLEDTSDFLTVSDNSYFENDEIIDIETLSQAVSTFTEHYNSMLKEASTSKSTSVTSEANNLSIYTDLQKTSLEKIGITVNSNSLLSFDSTVFKDADSASIKKALHDSGSFIYQISLKSTMINQYAKLAAYDTPSYSKDGVSLSTYESGSIIDSIF